MAGFGDAVGNLAGVVALFGGGGAVILGFIAHGRLIQRVETMEKDLGGDTGLKRQFQVMSDNLSGMASEQRATNRRLDGMDNRFGEMDKKFDQMTDRIIDAIRDQVKRTH